MAELTPEQQLAIISRAWGKQDGYCFFPSISGAATNKEERIKSWNEGPAFMWPKDKKKILAHMRSHTNDDLYWCPSLFETNRRVMEVAMDEHCLWADLDEVDPRRIDDYPPTIAWETSPGRYQALWLVSTGDLQGASWQGGENQRLTYHLGADVGGWDTTQLLRIPGWRNHKPEHRGGIRDGEAGQRLSEPVVGRLLWRSGRRYLPDEFEDLPQVPKQGDFEDILEDQIEAVDVKKVWGRVRLKLPAKARDMYGSREVMGDRSANLWWLMRCLADAGCTAVEIVAVLRPTVWNKFDGRGDELKRLTIEAGKAIAGRSDEAEKQVEAEREEKPRPIKLSIALANVKPPTWLIEGIWTEGACGFIAGQPKSFKSWCALDMALAVSSGMPFLDNFRVVRPGPVLYVQEEDGLPTVKVRHDKIWPNKKADRMVRDEDGSVLWLPATDMTEAKVMAAVNYNFVLSDPGWQAWLDEVLEEGYDGEPYRMVVMDPLMMIAGDVQENQAQDMTERLFKPMKQLARKHNVAATIVHHMRKTGGNETKGGELRGGQLMLGSVANHAWAEDALYIKLNRSGVTVELESKSAPSGHFDIKNIRNRSWAPHTTDVKGLLDDTVEEGESQGNGGSSNGSTNGSGRSARGSRRGPRKGDGAGRGLSPVVQTVIAHGSEGMTAQQLADELEISKSSVYQQLNRAQEKELLKKVGVRWVKG